MRCFHVVASCASSVLSLCASSVPVSSPFCNPYRPLHFSVPIRSVAPMRLPCFPCVRLLSSCIRLSCLGTSSSFTAFALLFLSLLCVRLLTHALYFPCVSFVPNSLSSCCSLPSFLSPSLGFPFPLVRVFSLVAPPSRCYSPFSPPPFPPLPLAFPRFPSPFLLSFPLLRFPLRKKFSLKSRVISSVKYMFYSIFLVCLGKFF